MENEKGLDLSLSLPCGGSGYTPKEKYESSSGSRSDEGDRGRKLINDFKNFLEGGNHQHLLKADENFCDKYGKTVMDSETSKNLNTTETWRTNDGKATVIEEEKRSCSGEKRKILFGETSFKKKHERETNRDLSDKNRSSHISINTDDGSTAENEDVGDFDADGLTSRLVSQHDDMTKSFVVGGSGSISRVQQENHAFDDSNDIEHVGQRRCAISAEKEFNLAILSNPCGVSFSTQPGNTANLSYPQSLKDSNPVGLHNFSGYSLPSMIHPLAANSERPSVQPVVPPNFPPIAAYTPVQLSAVDKDKTRGILSHHHHHHHHHSSYSGRNPIISDTQNDAGKLNQVITHKSIESSQYDGKVVEHAKSNGKQHIGEQGSFSNPGGILPGNFASHQVSDTSDQLRSESFPSEFPVIRAGIAADLKFGGSGTHPNLPWVSTTGSGPNGRTISGVTYRYSQTQIIIVCACHGSHMSPEGFIQHASEENFVPDSGTLLTSFPHGNPAAPAQN